MFSIIWTAIIGLVAGALAKLIMPGKDPGGVLLTMVLGVAGAFTATYLGQALGWYSAGKGAGLIGAVAGSILLLAGHRLLKKKQII